MLISGGLSSDDYEDIRPLLRDYNHNLVDACMIMLAVVFAANFVVDLVMHEPPLTHMAHFACVLVCLAMLICERFLHRRFPAVSTYAIYLLATVVYVYAVVIGVFARTDACAVTICVVIAVVPLVILDRPWRVVLGSLAATIIFMGLSWYSKPVEIAVSDFANSASACAIGILLAVWCISIRMQNLSYSWKSELERQTDGLTGLLNKVSFEKRAASFLAREENPEATLLIIDADNFKRVNDMYGHDEGDRVLKEMATTIREAFRTSDYVGRFGGDEFVVFMQDCINRRAAIKCAKRLIARMPERVKLPDEEDVFHVSVGVAFSDCIPDDLMPSTDDPLSYKSLFIAADRALYQAKNSGRDCFCIAGYDSAPEEELEE